MMAAGRLKKLAALIILLSVRLSSSDNDPLSNSSVNDLPKKPPWRNKLTRMVLLSDIQLLLYSNSHCRPCRTDRALLGATHSVKLLRAVDSQTGEPFEPSSRLHQRTCTCLIPDQAGILPGVPSDR